MSDHSTHVTVHTGRYPYRAACECGWRGHRGYIAAHAAQYEADDHTKETQHADRD